MAGNGLSTLARVKLVVLIPPGGLPSDAYKLSVSTLSQSLVQYSAAIIQLPICDASLLRSCLESSRLYFLHKPSFPSTDVIDDSREWCKTSGYHTDPQMWQETYDFRPGVTFTEHANETEIPPSDLVDIFGLLGKVCRGVLDAMAFYLNLRSLRFTEILNNTPLGNREVSSSVLSISHHNLTAREDGQLVMFSDHDEHQVDRSLLTLIKSDRAGLHIRDFNGHWVLVDGDLGLMKQLYILVLLYIRQQQVTSILHCIEQIQVICRTLYIVVVLLHSNSCLNP